MSKSVVAFLMVGHFLVFVNPLRADELLKKHDFDLSHWKLALPVDSNGKTKGRAMEVLVADLNSGYSHDPYYYRGTEGQLIFWSPVTGATTQNTKYPRSELRELIEPGDDNVCWRGPGTHTLRARCRVLEVPSSEKVIVGQIHSHSGQARPLIKLLFSKGRIEAFVKEKASEGKDLKLIFAEIGLDKDLDYEIKLHDGMLSVTVNGETQAVDVFMNDRNWAKQTFYFKVGAYTQDNEGPACEGARVSFSSFKVNHE